MKHSSARERKVKKVRHRIAELGSLRLTVFRTPRHIYAQLFTADGSKVLTSASSVEKDVRKEIAAETSSGKINIAQKVGALLADRAKTLGIDRVAFDRSGYKFHGRVKALAEAVRENGVQC
ncbi:MAG: 50S ribosomal protein L18 [Francisellaceae bacterium]|jgi:large subunit ribosomal protein L18|nr:50S ribosomal protein L18 [Francisellaceae bacterium]MBT6539113.1 50S ribosomal protein L18 [Francisellaceae bacterium]